MIHRCGWVPINDELYTEYHDKEWGVPVYDDRTLFEFLILEGFQAGLSWRTILYKRENFRKAFDRFDPEMVARYAEHKIQELLIDAGIIRNNLKIRAAIQNARCFLEVQNEFGSFKNYIWRFTEGKTIKNAFKRNHEIPATSAISDTMSKDLKKRGFKFVGSTVCYAHMQATGMVNDHLVNCFRYNQV
ncbi:MAG: DNA-3-methyladenine glycosylase I [Calditrichaceae bacterium]|nr:DNA-3-methyladenine glycosylase I [Calditrichaceae bacterium]HES59571.1 DNA-3-methyladenine glycosylase I [Caldithrix sp.]